MHAGVDVIDVLDGKCNKLQRTLLQIPKLTYKILVEFSDAITLYNETCLIPDQIKQVF